MNDEILEEIRCTHRLCSLANFVTREAGLLDGYGIVALSVGAGGAGVRGPGSCSKTALRHPPAADELPTWPTCPSRSRPRHATAMGIAFDPDGSGGVWDVEDLPAHDAAC